MIPPRRVEIFKPDIPRMMIQVSVVMVFYPIPIIGRYWIGDVQLRDALSA